jgi:hypothetical protein
LDFVRRPVFKKRPEETHFGNGICFRPEVKGGETPILLGPVERANPNHWEITILPNVLAYRTIDKVQKPSNSECYTPSSEPFIIYLLNRYGSDIYILPLGNYNN